LDNDRITKYAIEEIKKDAYELTKTAIEDNIGKTPAVNMFHPLTPVW
jgi:hypothetical protein